MKWFTKNLIRLFIILISAESLYSQSIITGIIKASDTKESIPFAIIKIESSGKLTSSNDAGIFRILLPSIKEKISISSIGYQTQSTETSSSDSSIIIYLEPSSLNLGEVNVYASKSGMQASNLESLKNIEAYSLAGTTKDIFRSVQMLPGVSSNNAASAQYNVRGGTYDENLMLINGIEVAEPYHIKVFPMASVGIFNIDMVQRIDFSSGGFSAEYGDALSSVLNVDYRKANNDSICGRVNLGMIDLGVLAEIPTSKKTSLLIAARQSYLDPVIKFIDVNEKISIRYYDVQAKFDYEINNRNKISILGIVSQDNDKVGPQLNISKSTFYGKYYQSKLTINQTERSSFLLDSKYNDVLLAILSKNNISGKVILNSEISYYHEKENTPQTETDTLVNTFSVPGLFYRSYFYWNNLKEYQLSTYEYKLSANFAISQNHSLKTGGFVRLSKYDYTSRRTSFYDNYNNTERFPDTSKYILRPDDVDQNSTTLFNANAWKTGVYGTYQWQLNHKLVFTAGIRTDYFSLNKELDFSPRLNTSYSINSKWKATVSWGIFNKSPIMKQLKYSFASVTNTQNQQAIHYLVGVERKYDDKILKVETYYKQYYNLIPAWRSANGEIFYETKDNNAEGYAVGIDFEYIINKPHFDVWFIYSLCSSKEKLKGTSNYYSRYTDQTHTISSLFVFKMRNRKQLETKFTYGSGYTYQSKTYNTNTRQWILGNSIKTKHLPYYLTIDVRFKKEFRIRSKPLQVYVDIMNILDRKNILGHQYRINNNGPFEEDYKFLGILPTFGIIYDF